MPDLPPRAPRGAPGGSPATGRCVGVVLAGGSSRRMGFDKAGAMLRGRTLLSRACERLAPQCAALAVSRRGGQANGAGADYPIVSDAAPEARGPLAGILAALDWAAARDFPGVTHVASAAVDTPFLPDDLVHRLAARQAAGGAAVVCAASDGRIHPVAALWPVAARAALRALIVDGGTRRVTEALDRLGYATVAWDADGVDPFLNVNTADDLARAETLAEALEGASAVRSQ